MTEYTPEKVAELVAESRVKHCSDCDHFIGAMGTALTAVSADLRRATWQFQDAENANADNMKVAQESQADRDRLHKAITEALEGGYVMTETPRRILRAALDKEGNGDE